MYDFVGVSVCIYLYAKQKNVHIFTILQYIPLLQHLPISREIGICHVKTKEKKRNNKQFPFSFKKQKNTKNSSIHVTL